MCFGKVGCRFAHEGQNKRAGESAMRIPLKPTNMRPGVKCYVALAPTGAAHLTFTSAGAAAKVSTLPLLMFPTAWVMLLGVFSAASNECPPPTAGDIAAWRNSADDRLIHTIHTPSVCF